MFKVVRKKKLGPSRDRAREEGERVARALPSLSLLDVQRQRTEYGGKGWAKEGGGRRN